MVRYIGVADVQRWVRSLGVERFLVELARYVREDFLRWQMFDKSTRLASHSRVGVIELMPISDGELYSFKFVNGHPKNTAAGKLTVTAFGVLADVATGYPLLLSELTVLTALRTAATSALAASVLARPDAHSMALIGNGAQSEFQALAFKAMLGITEVRLFDVDPAATDKLARHLARVPGMHVVRACSTREAVRGADIVTTATADKTNATILTPDMIEPGMHLNAIGGDCPGKTELHIDVVRNARVVVEYAPQTRIEGEIQQLGADFPVAPLADVLDGREAGREGARQVTLFDSVGFALEDFSALRYLRDLAEDTHDARALDLIPQVANPKDLYQLVEPVATLTLQTVLSATGRMSVSPRRSAPSATTQEPALSATNR